MTPERAGKGRKVADRDRLKLGSGGFLSFRVDQRGPVETGELEVWSLVASLEAEGLSAETSIWLGPHGVELSLANFFADLAKEWRGWIGAKEWVGMEGGLRLSCTHDGLGHVRVHVSLNHLSGAGWEVSVAVPVDAGQLDAVAREMRELLAQ